MEKDKATEKKYDKFCNYFDEDKACKYSTCTN